MTILVFTNSNGQLNVQYKVDLINTNSDNLTVMEVVGLSDAEVVAGINFAQLNYTLTSFKQFATANNLILKKVDQESTSTLINQGTALNITSVTGDLAGGTDDTPYVAETLVAVGGNAPYTWTISAGALPAGMTLSSAGVISGTPTAAGVANFTVRVTDAFGVTDTQALAITIS